MSTTSLIRALKRGWWLIVSLVIIGGAVGAGVSLLMTPVYESTSRIFVAFDTPVGAGAGDLVQANNFAIQKVYSYIEVAGSPRVMTRVVDELGLDISAADLALDVKVSVPTNSAVLNITAQAANPQDAAALSSAVVDAFTEVVLEIETPSGGGVAPVRIESLETATAPETPASPNVLLNVALGLFVGLAVSLIALAITAATDRRIRSSADIVPGPEETGDIVVLGSIPRGGRGEGLTAMHDEPGSRVAESYRTVAAGVGHSPNPMPKVISVAPCVPPESASELTMNLGLAFAEFGARVVVVDTNLRTGSITSGLGLGTAPGVTDYLGGASLADVLSRTGKYAVAVLPSGRVVGSPAELFASSRLPNLIRELRGMFDVVILDSSPVLPLSDALALADAADATIVALASGRVSDEELAAATQSLESIGANVLGVVVTDAHISGVDADPAVTPFRDLRSRPGA